MKGCIDCGIDHGPMFPTLSGWVCECCMVDRRNVEREGGEKKKAPVLLVAASVVALLTIVIIGLFHALGWQ